MTTSMLESHWVTTKKDGKAFDPTILLEYIRSVKSSCMTDLF